jgi:DNA-binding GntR family transcriptional regulator
MANDLGTIAKGLDDLANRESIRELVYQQLRQQIVDGGFTPSSRMVASRIAEQLGVSRTPVREALHVLENEGLLQYTPRAGYRVGPLRWEEVSQLSEIRIVNETLAAIWAMDRITPGEISSLNDNIDQSEADLKNGNTASFVELDAEFHARIARSSGSERLFEICQGIRRHMLRYRIASLYLPDTGLVSIRGHRRLLAAIADKDRGGIEGAVRQHLEESKNYILRYAFEERGLESGPQA